MPEPTESESFDWNEWLPTIAVALAVLLAITLFSRGCGNNQSRVSVSGAVRISDSEKQTQREPVQTAIVWVADSYHCPSCVTLKDDLEWLKRNYKGWGGLWSYRIDNRGQVPRVEYFVNGQMVNSHIGYTASNDWRKREPILKSIVARF